MRKIRRAKALAVRWHDNDLVLRNYLEQTQVTVSSAVLDLLTLCSTPVEYSLLASHPVSAEACDLLSRHKMLLEIGSDEDRRDQMVVDEWSWGAETLEYHLGSRPARYISDEIGQATLLRELTLEKAPPPPYPACPKKAIRLSPNFIRELPSLSDVLSRRRTKRHFRKSSLSFSDFSDLVFWTWGVTAENRTIEGGRTVLRTSPSAGSRHPIDVYPVALNVEALEAGIYYYHSAANAVELLNKGRFSDDMTEALGGHEWVRDAACVFLMVCVSCRTSWKYRHSRAYRVVHLDAGHLGQTFHLVCTALGLGPFTTAATDDSTIERLLGIDSPQTFHIYGAAVGCLGNEDVSETV